MSTQNTIASTVTPVKLSFFTTVDNNLRVTSPDGKIPNTPYVDFSLFQNEAASQKVNATTVSPTATITATGVQFCNPS